MTKNLLSIVTEPRSVVNFHNDQRFRKAALLIVPPTSQANIRLEAYGYAIADASKAIELDPTYVKACIVNCSS